MDRLVKYGVPATVLHRQVDERDQIGRARQAAETVIAVPPNERCLVFRLYVLTGREFSLSRWSPLQGGLFVCLAFCGATAVTAVGDCGDGF